MRFVRLNAVVGDTPQFVLVAADGRTGDPIDVSAADVVCRMKTRPLFGASPATTTTLCSKLAGREVAGGIDTTAPYDVAGKGGRVLAACDATVFPAAGDYEGELEVTTAGTQVFTAFAMLRITVRNQL